jgi:hypothetical protein
MHLGIGDGLQADKDRFAEYPKLRDLVAAKDDQVKRFATPPMFLKVGDGSDSWLATVLGMDVTLNLQLR